MCSFARAFINRWAKGIDADREFISRIKSKDDKQHEAAMHELLFFAVCKNAGFDIEKNPVIPNIKTPDFKIRLNELAHVYLECSLAGNAMESPEEHRKQASVMQIIEDLTDYPYLISPHFAKLSKESISKREFKVFLKQLALICDGSLPNKEQSLEYMYLGQGWEIGIRMFRKRIISQRTLGGITHHMGPVDNFKHLYTALNDKKPGKYRISNQAYVICLAFDDLSANEYEFSEVLFGQFHNQRLILNPQMNGFFYSAGKPINENISGVLFCKSLKIFGLNDTEISFWHNPYARFPVPRVFFPFEEVYFEIDEHKLLKNKSKPSQTVLELLSIDKTEYLRWFELKNRLPPKAH
jgi:hypothetical protein